MKEYCQHCGAKMVEYKHSMSKGLMRGLYKLASHGGGPINLNELKLTLPQQTNFQKLKYWGVVEKSDSSNLKGGNWMITELGWKFIMDEILLFKSVWTYRGVAQRLEGEEVLFSEVTGGYKYRQEYAAEAMPRR